ncbi:hypothetical protein Ac2012v2_007311 [Leucoagaricus gongylophorus]
MPRATAAAPIVPQSSKTNVPSSLVALPSVSQSLYSLPSATNVKDVFLHVSSFSQHPRHSEAKLKAALNRNLAVAKQRQEEEQKRRLREMEDAARLWMLEEQQVQVQVDSEPSSPLTIKTRVRLSLEINVHDCLPISLQKTKATPQN